MPSTQSSEWFSEYTRMYLDWMSSKIERLRTASGNRYLDFSAALWDKWANNMRLHCPTLRHNLNILSVTKLSVCRKFKHREGRILERYFSTPYCAGCTLTQAILISDYSVHHSVTTSYFAYFPFPTKCKPRPWTEWTGEPVELFC